MSASAGPTPTGPTPAGPTPAGSTPAGSTPTGSTQAVPTANRKGLVVVAICFAAIVLDGYDLIVFGAIAPALLSHPEWDLTPAAVGLIGSYTLIGMVVGGLVIGALTDVLGRRRIIIACVLWFNLGAVACAMAPTPELLGLFRFLSGLGLGGLMPTAIALTQEYAPRGKRQLYHALMFSGYSLGGILAATTALFFLEDQGFRFLLWIGATPALVLVPLAYFLLPESMSHLTARGRPEEARRLAEAYGVEPEPAPARPAGGARWSDAFRFLAEPGTRWVTVGFAVAAFCSLLLVYGLNTWLPEIMVGAGYPLVSSLSFLLVLNIGSIVGGLCGAVFADRVGPKAAVALSFGVAALTLVLLSFRLPMGLLYLGVALAGLGSIGTQLLLNGYAAASYPAHARATAVGIILSVGRLGAITGPIMMGLMLGSELGHQWNFYAFLIPAAVGLSAILLLPRLMPAQRERERAPVG